MLATKDMFILKVTSSQGKYKSAIGYRNSEPLQEFLQFIKIRLFYFCDIETSNRIGRVRYSLKTRRPQAAGKN
jgi:hypothetical protein